MDTFVVLTEVQIGVIYRIYLMIGPDPQTYSSYACSMGFMPCDKVDQGKTLTLFCTWDCVVIYAL